MLGTLKIHFSQVEKFLFPRVYFKNKQMNINKLTKKQKKNPKHKFLHALETDKLIFLQHFSHPLLSCRRQRSGLFTIINCLILYQSQSSQVFPVCTFSFLLLNSTNSTLFNFFFFQVLDNTFDVVCTIIFSERTSAEEHLFENLTDDKWGWNNYRANVGIK